MQLEQNMLKPREDDNTSDNFGPYEDVESTPEAQDIEVDHRDSICKSSDTGSRARA